MGFRIGNAGANNYFWKLQPRDGRGRWIFMGGIGSWIDMGRRRTGQVVGSDDKGNITMRVRSTNGKPDTSGKRVTIPSKNIEMMDVKAVLDKDSIPGFTRKDVEKAQSADRIKAASYPTGTKIDKYTKDGDNSWKDNEGNSLTNDQVDSATEESKADLSADIPEDAPLTPDNILNAPEGSKLSHNNQSYTKGEDGWYSDRLGRKVKDSTVSKKTDGDLTVADNDQDEDGNAPTPTKASELPVGTALTAEKEDGDSADLDKTADNAWDVETDGNPSTSVDDNTVDKLLDASDTVEERDSDSDSESSSSSETETDVNSETDSDTEDSDNKPQTRKVGDWTFTRGENGRWRANTSSGPGVANNPPVNNLTDAQMDAFENVGEHNGEKAKDLPAGTVLYIPKIFGGDSPFYEKGEDGRWKDVKGNRVGLREVQDALDTYTSSKNKQDAKDEENARINEDIRKNPHKYLIRGNSQDDDSSSDTAPETETETDTDSTSETESETEETKEDSTPTQEPAPEAEEKTTADQNIEKLNDYFDNSERPSMKINDISEQINGDDRSVEQVTDEDFDSLDSPVIYRGVKDKDSFYDDPGLGEEGLFFTDDKSEAATYGDTSLGADNVVEAKLAPDAKVVDLDTLRQEIADHENDKGTTSAVMKSSSAGTNAIILGYDAISVPGKNGKSDVTVVVNPKKLITRSRDDQDNSDASTEEYDTSKPAAEQTDGTKFNDGDITYTKDGKYWESEDGESVKTNAGIDKIYAKRSAEDTDEYVPTPPKPRVPNYDQDSLEAKAKELGVSLTASRAYQNNLDDAAITAELEEAARWSDKVNSRYAESDPLSEHPEIERHEPEALEGEAFPPTQQQQDVIDAITSKASVVVRAMAGSGKTSTVVAAAKRMKEMGMKGVYLAFNKSVSDEAKERMPDNMEVHTSHALASAWGRKFNKSLMRRFDVSMNPSKFPDTAKPVNSPREIADYLGIPGNDTFVRNRMAQDAKNAIDTFLLSGDDELSMDHVDETAIPRAVDAKTGQLRPLSDEEQEKLDQILVFAKKGWDDMMAPEGRMKVTHDAYRKAWALTHPDLTNGSSGVKTPGSDVVFIDEAQDTASVLSQVIRDQNNMGRVIVGDPNQAIYSFAGNEDFLSSIEDKVDVSLPLNASWRFGTTASELGNRFMQIAGSKDRVQGKGNDNGRLLTVQEAADFNPAAVISRSNKGVISAIIEESSKGRRVASTKGMRENLNHLADTVEALQEGRPLSNPHPDLAGYNDWSEVLMSDSPDVKLAATIFEPPMDRGDTNIDHTPQRRVERIQEVRKAAQSIVEPMPEFDSVHFDQQGMRNFIVEDKKWGSNNLLAAVGRRIDPSTANAPGTYQERSKAQRDVARAKYGIRWDSKSKQWYSDDPGALERMQSDFSPESDVLVTTAHKAKGLEFDSVRVGNDFDDPTDPERGDRPYNRDEVLLNYVTVTRSKGDIDPGSLRWILDSSDPNGGDMDSNSRKMVFSDDYLRDDAQKTEESPDLVPETPESTHERAEDDIDRSSEDAPEDAVETSPDADEDIEDERGAEYSRGYAESYDAFVKEMEDRNLISTQTDDEDAEYIKVLDDKGVLDFIREKGDKEIEGEDSDYQEGSMDALDQLLTEIPLKSSTFSDHETPRLDALADEETSPRSDNEMDLFDSKWRNARAQDEAQYGDMDEAIRQYHDNEDAYEYHKAAYGESADMENDLRTTADVIRQYGGNPESAQDEVPETSEEESTEAPSVAQNNTPSRKSADSVKSGDDIDWEESDASEFDQDIRYFEDSVVKGADGESYRAQVTRETNPEGGRAIWRTEVYDSEGNEVESSTSSTKKAARNKAAKIINEDQRNRGQDNATEPKSPDADVDREMTDDAQKVGAVKKELISDDQEPHEAPEDVNDDTDEPADIDTDPVAYDASEKTATDTDKEAVSQSNEDRTPGDKLVIESTGQELTRDEEGDLRSANGTRYDDSAVEAISSSKGGVNTPGSYREARAKGVITRPGDPDSPDRIAVIDKNGRKAVFDNNGREWKPLIGTNQDGSPKYGRGVNSSTMANILDSSQDHRTFNRPGNAPSGTNKEPVGDDVDTTSLPIAPEKSLGQLADPSAKPISDESMVKEPSNAATDDRQRAGLTPNTVLTDDSGKAVGVTDHQGNAIYKGDRIVTRDKFNRMRSGIVGVISTPKDPNATHRIDITPDDKDYTTEGNNLSLEDYKAMSPKDRVEAGYDKKHYGKIFSVTSGQVNSRGMRRAIDEDSRESLATEQERFDTQYNVAGEVVTVEDIDPEAPNHYVERDADTRILGSRNSEGVLYRVGEAVTLPTGESGTIKHIGEANGKISIVPDGKDALDAEMYSVEDLSHSKTPTSYTNRNLNADPKDRVAKDFNNNELRIGDQLERYGTKYTVSYIYPDGSKIRVVGNDYVGDQGSAGRSVFIDYNDPHSHEFLPEHTQRANIGDEINPMMGHDDHQQAYQERDSEGIPLDTRQNRAVSNTRTFYDNESNKQWNMATAKRRNQYGQENKEYRDQAIQPGTTISSGLDRNLGTNMQEYYENAFGSDMSIPDDSKVLGYNDFGRPEVYIKKDNKWTIEHGDGKEMSAREFAQYRQENGYRRGPGDRLNQNKMDMIYLGKSDDVAVPSRRKFLDKKNDATFAVMPVGSVVRYKDGNGNFTTIKKGTDGQWYYTKSNNNAVGQVVAPSDVPGSAQFEGVENESVKIPANIREQVTRGGRTRKRSKKRAEPTRFTAPMGTTVREDRAAKDAEIAQQKQEIADQSALIEALKKQIAAQGGDPESITASASTIKAFKKGTDRVVAVYNRVSGDTWEHVSRSGAYREFTLTSVPNTPGITYIIEETA